MNTPCIENRTFEEIAIGDEARLSRTLTWTDIEPFAAMLGDVNPAHVDEEFAKSDMFHRIIAHGMCGGALISTVLGTELPGPGTVYLSETLNLRHPIGLGDTVTVTVRATAKTVIEGPAEVIAPGEKICRKRVALPQIELHQPRASTGAPSDFKAKEVSAFA